MSSTVVLRRVCLRAARAVRDDGRLKEPRAALRKAIRREAVKERATATAEARAALTELLFACHAAERTSSTWRDCAAMVPS